MNLTQQTTPLLESTLASVRAQIDELTEYEGKIREELHRRKAAEIQPVPPYATLESEMCLNVEPGVTVALTCTLQKGHTSPHCAHIAKGILGASWPI